MRATSIFIVILVFFNQLNAQRRKIIPPEKPKLVVGIVIEHMRYDYLYRYLDKFGDKGFKKLLNEGTNCKNNKYTYLYTQTAPGMASISTGASPHAHGIVADFWFDQTKNKLTYCVDDKNAKPIGGNDREGYVSPSLLSASTLGDELKLASFKKSKIFGMSLDSRSSILMAGRAANAAYWFDSFSGNWMSSNFYIDSLPNWVKNFNNKDFPTLYLSQNWEPSLPIGDYTESLEDRNDYEVGFKKNKITFPYDIPKLKKRNDKSLLFNIPAGNKLTKDFAINTIINEQLGKDETPDLLMLSFTAMGEIAKKFGPLSIEIEDAYIKLDNDISHLLDFIDKEIGKENTLIFLTSDHGSAYPPAYLKENKINAGVFKPLAAISLLKSYMNALYGKGNWVQHYHRGQVYLNHGLIEDSKIRLVDIQKKVADFLVQFTGVANSTTSSSLLNTTFADGIFRKMQKGFYQKRSGDVLINLEPGWIEDTENATSANSSYDYDSHVPLLWHGWKIKRNIVVEPVSPEDIAPTIATFLDIPFPNACTGKPIRALIEF